MKRICYKIFQLPIYATILERRAWFKNHHLQRVLFEKHAAGGVMLIPPADMRYDFNFVADHRLLRCRMTCRKVVGYTVYINKKMQDD